MSPKMKGERGSLKRRGGTSFGKHFIHSLCRYKMLVAC